jgi:hypothetical protein
MRFFVTLLSTIMASPSKASTLSSITLSHNATVVRDRMFRLAGCAHDPYGALERVDGGYDWWVAMSDQPELYKNDTELVSLSHLISVPFDVTWRAMKELQLYGHGIKYNNWPAKFGTCIEEDGSIGNVLPFAFDPKHARSKGGPSSKATSTTRSKMWWVNLAQRSRDEAPDNTAHHRVGAQRAQGWIIRTIATIGTLELLPDTPGGK